MAQLKTDEWPDDGEATTTETQVRGSASEPRRENEGRPDRPPADRGDQELLNIGPDDAAD